MNGAPQERGLGRVVLVTGAGSGIGAAVARALAAPGCALLLATRANARGLSATADAARAAGAEVATARADLARPGAAGALVAQAVDRFGRLDQIVATAGYAQQARFGDFGAEELTAAFAVNTLPFVGLASAALDQLRASSWGRVVAISSFVAHHPGVNGRFFAATGASKGALEVLARSLALQLAPEGVTVNCVVPGHTRKDGGQGALHAADWQAAAAATPAGRLAEPEDIAAAVVFLLSRGARHITGQTLFVDGGLSLR